MNAYILVLLMHLTLNSYSEDALQLQAEMDYRDGQTFCEVHFDLPMCESGIHPQWEIDNWYTPENLTVMEQE